MNPQKILYEGIRVIEAGISKTIEIDTSQLKVLTPGKGDVKNPVVYKFHESITKVEYPLSRYYSQWAPVIIKAKQTKPLPAQPMRMKDVSCFNLHWLDTASKTDATNICATLLNTTFITVVAEDGINTSHY